MPVPPPPEWELGATLFDPMAVSVADAIPNGYLSGVTAERACDKGRQASLHGRRMGRRVPRRENRKFPYGEVYQEGRCNVFLAVPHPAWSSPRRCLGRSSGSAIEPALPRTAIRCCVAPAATPDCKSVGEPTRSTTWSGTWTNGLTTPTARSSADFTRVALGRGATHASTSTRTITSTIRSAFVVASSSRSAREL